MSVKDKLMSPPAPGTRPPVSKAVAATPRDQMRPSPGLTGMQTPQDQFISPSTRSQLGLTSPVPALPLTTVNDDEAEKRERRRSRVLELQRRHISSPATPTDASAKRRSIAPLNGLSNAQLADHYTNCIKLSAENKINAKNAFGLHLIDYLSDLIKKKEMNNFQVASSTLDASAKIYAGRVDAIHTEAYKVLTGLGRSSDKPEKGSDTMEGEMAEDDTEKGDGDKKQKRVRRSNTIEQNLKNINVKKFDLEFEVDPLFQKTSATFDEGGTGGLLLNHFTCLDDTLEVILDSNTITNTGDGEKSERGLAPIEVRQLKGLFYSTHLENLHISPDFLEFSFTNWNRDAETTLSSMMRRASMSKTHAFDLDAEPEPLPTQDILGEGGLMDEDMPPDFGGGDDEDGDTSQHEITLGDGKEAHVVSSAIDNLKHGTIGTLMQVLASEPSDYSYFKTDLLRTWAGPEHWKMKPRSKEPGENTTVGTDKQKREKKEPLVLDYTEEVDFEAAFKKTRAATTLTKATLNKYSKGQTTLPEDLHYDAENLLKLFVKPNVMVKRQDSNTEEVDQGIDNYDYDNANDRANFCPGVEDNEDDDDDVNIGEFSFTGGLDGSQEDGIEPGMSQTLDGTILTGDKLVQQPRKVEKIDIAYALTAKKMDVKRLKAAMWKLLAQEEEDKENVDETNAAATAPIGNKAVGKHSFRDMVGVLPAHVSKQMAQNLSVPIAFVCLLHLANEKCLKIMDLPDMTDLTISQG